MNKAMIEIEKLKKEIELLKEEKSKNVEKQNGLKEDLRIYNLVNSEKKYFMKKLKVLKIKKALLYALYGIIFALMVSGVVIASCLNSLIGLLLFLLGTGSLLANEFPKIVLYLLGEGSSANKASVLDLFICDVQSKIDDIKDEFEKAKEVGKVKENYEAQVSSLEGKNNEINDLINKKNKKIDKLVALRKEAIDELSTIL